MPHKSSARNVPQFETQKVEGSWKRAGKGWELMVVKGTHDGSARLTTTNMPHNCDGRGPGRAGPGHTRGGVPLDQQPAVDGCSHAIYRT